MAIITLLPNSTETTHTSHWQVYGEATHHECLDDDNGDTSYVKCSTNFRIMRIGFANPSVAEADIASIDAVTFLSSGRSTHRTTASNVSIQFEIPSGFSEAVSYDPHASNYETITGTTRTTQPDSSAWTYSALEGLVMKCTKTSTIEVRLSYLALKVSYTEAAADNATFFGANF